MAARAGTSAASFKTFRATTTALFRRLSALWTKFLYHPSLVSLFFPFLFLLRIRAIVVMMMTITLSSFSFFLDTGGQKESTSRFLVVTTVAVWAAPRYQPLESGTEAQDEYEVSLLCHPSTILSHDPPPPPPPPYHPLLPSSPSSPPSSLPSSSSSSSLFACL